MSSSNKNGPDYGQPSWLLIMIIPLLLSAMLGATAPLIIATLGAFVIGEWWNRQSSHHYNEIDLPAFGTIGCSGATLAVIIRLSTKAFKGWSISSDEQLLFTTAISGLLVSVLVEVYRFFKKRSNN